jgi:hypothetical protein
MKIAILYTGEVRTLIKTIPYFEEHLLLQNPDAHVFAVLQCNLEERPNIMDVLNHHMNNKLHNLEWFEKEDNLWRELQNRLLSSMQISENWNNYLKNSGSMIEYYQMYLAYQKIVDYEYRENFKYDYVIRIRCDVIITHPIYFDWDSFDESYIKQCFEEIQKQKNYENLINPDALIIFMNSIFFKNRIYCTTKIDNNCIISSDNFKIFLQTSNEKIF